MRNADLQRLYYQTKNELLAFRNELNKLSVSSYPTELDQTILEKLQEKTDGYGELLKKIMADVDEDEQDPNIINQCKEKITTDVHIPLLSQDIKFLNWLYKAQTKRVPWSFVNCIEKLVAQLLPDKKILICCDDRYNYEICWSGSAKVAPYPYYIISLPLLHRINILWHTLIGHELFHPRCSEFIDIHNQKILTEIRNEVVKNPEKFLPNREEGGAETLFSKREKEGLLLAISDTIRFAWIRAMEEILCDMACFEMFGPSALLAMRAFSAYSPENSIPEPDNNFYPSWQYRLEVVWNNFIDESKIQRIVSSIGNKEIAASFEKEVGKIKKTVEKKEGDNLVKKHKHAKVAYEEIDKILNDAVQFVKKTLPSTIEKWHDEKVIKQIPELVQRLENGIPPNEIINEVSSEDDKYSTEPASLAALLMAGWIYECYWQEKKCNRDDDIMTYQTMSRLLLKACEDIETISEIQNVNPHKKSNTV